MIKSIVNLLKKLCIITIFSFLIGNIILYSYCFFSPKLDIKNTKSYYLYDNNGNNIFNEDDDWVKLEDISENLINATIAVEDKNFYKHIGFDYLRIVKAAIKNIKSQSLKEGASTITQQYARNLYLNYNKTWNRKIEEAIIAARLETHYTKQEILEGYLNTINYGGIYGIESASFYYFGHGANELNLAEASILAGIPQSPSNYSPISNENNAKKRQYIVLNSMYNNKYIKRKQISETYDYKLNFIGKIKEHNLENILYFRDSVINELSNIDSLPKNLLNSNSIKIYTTLDLNAQEILEKAVKNNMTQDDNLEVAGLMMNPTNGEVMALIGGRDYLNSQFNRATNAKRQVGSIMKPILYYSALENGFTSTSTFTSEKTTFNFSNGKKYTPNNYNNKYANGNITMGAAISYSDNIYAVKTNLFLGESSLINMAKRLGIKSHLNNVPSLALGTSEISMIEMVEAYCSFANMGYKVKNHFINKIEDMDGNILYEFKQDKEIILNASLSFILSEMLTYTYDNTFIDYNYPTLINLLPQITNKYSVKTGTTDTDNWIIGYNKNAVLSIWNGYDNNKKIVNSFHKNIWIETMEKYLRDKNNEWYEVPKNVIGCFVDPISGIIDESNKKNKLFYFLKGTEPTGINNYESVFKEENSRGIEN